MSSHPFSARLFRIASLLVLVVAVGAPAAAAEYTVDPLRSTLLLRIWKEGGAASAFAHDHVIRAARLVGTVRYDASKPQASTVEVTAETAGLVADDPTYRRRYSLPQINEQSRREVQRTMLSAKQMDAKTYPTIVFKSTRVQEGEANKLDVTGTLTLHGQTRELTVPATVDLVQGLLRARATLRFRQSDFGITPYSFANTVSNRDEVELHIELIAAPAAAG